MKDLSNEIRNEGEFMELHCSKYKSKSYIKAKREAKVMKILPNVEYHYNDLLRYCFVHKKTMFGIGNVKTRFGSLEYYPEVSIDQFTFSISGVTSEYLKYKLRIALNYLVHPSI